MGGTKGEKKKEMSVFVFLGQGGGRAFVFFLGDHLWVRGHRAHPKGRAGPEPLETKNKKKKKRGNKGGGKGKKKKHKTKAWGRRRKQKKTTTRRGEGKSGGGENKSVEKKKSERRGWKKKKKVWGFSFYCWGH